MFLARPFPFPPRSGPDDYDNHSNNDGEYESSNSTHIPRPPSSVGASDSDDATRQAALETDDDLDFSMDPCPPTAVVVGKHVATASYLDSNSSRRFTVEEKDTVFPAAAVVVPRPSPKEQSRIVDKVSANKELMIPKPGQTRFAISNRYMIRYIQTYMRVLSGFVRECDIFDFFASEKVYKVCSAAPGTYGGGVKGSRKEERRV